MMAADINPDYKLEPANPATRQPERERARRVLFAIFGDNVPDPGELSNKLLLDQIHKWLETNKQKSLGYRTILRAAGRR